MPQINPSILDSLQNPEYGLQAILQTKASPETKGWASDTPYEELYKGMSGQQVRNKNIGKALQDLVMVALAKKMQQAKKEEAVRGILDYLSESILETEAPGGAEGRALGSKGASKEAGETPGVPDGTGPYGRGAGPGKGTASGLGLLLLSRALNISPTELAGVMATLNQPAKKPEKKEASDANELQKQLAYLVGAPGQLGDLGEVYRYMQEANKSKDQEAHNSGTIKSLAYLALANMLNNPKMAPGIDNIKDPQELLAILETQTHDSDITPRPGGMSNKQSSQTKESSAPWKGLSRQDVEKFMDIYLSQKQQEAINELIGQAKERSWSLRHPGISAAISLGLLPSLAKAENLPRIERSLLMRDEDARRAVEVLARKMEAEKTSSDQTKEAANTRLGLILPLLLAGGLGAGYLSNPNDIPGMNLGDQWEHLVGGFKNMPNAISEGYQTLRPLAEEGIGTLGNLGEQGYNALSNLFKGSSADLEKDAAWPMWMQRWLGRAGASAFANPVMAASRAAYPQGLLGGLRANMARMFGAGAYSPGGRIRAMQAMKNQGNARILNQATRAVNQWGQNLPPSSSTGQIRWMG